jgi:hypothetical protein
MTIALHASKGRGEPRKARPAAKPKAGKTGKSRRPSGMPHETSRDPRSEFNDEEWHDMVATAAYFRAESRGFEGGSPDEDWFEAEAQLREQLARAEDEADERAESGLDLSAHKPEGKATSKE